MYVERVLFGSRYWEPKSGSKSDRSNIDKIVHVLSIVEMRSLSGRTLCRASCTSLGASTKPKLKPKTEVFSTAETCLKNNLN